MVQFGVVACIADRAPIWKSLVLPASGATLGWLLLLTLWLPLLNYARSYAPQVQNVVRLMNNAPQGCAYKPSGLSRGQIAAFQYHGGMNLQAAAPG